MVEHLKKMENRRINKCISVKGEERRARGRFKNTWGKVLKAAFRTKQLSRETASGHMQFGKPFSGDVS